MSLSIAILTVIFSYLIGSVSSAIIVCRLMGLPDPRTEGSRNPGATNVLRIGGKKAAIITLVGDTLKGVLPVLAAKALGLDAAIIGLTMFAAFIGHLYPVFFRFEGGKGVATAIGGILALNFPAGLCWMATWATMAYFFRYSSLASLTASALAPLYIWLLTDNWTLVAIVAIMSLILVIRHRSNIEKLLAGKESKIGKKN